MHKKLIRMLGLFLLLAGLGVVYYYFVEFDTSVYVPGGSQFGIDRINNLGLMSERQNGIIVGSVSMLIGIFLMFFGRDSTQGVSATEKKCPYCMELVKTEAIICKHCGKDLPKHEKL